MYVGHINLSKSFNGAGENFVRLIEALHDRGTTQYVIVRNVALAKRLDLVDDGLTVGPTVRSAVMAYVLMPHVDVVHVHNPADGQAGLLLTLTRSIPYVLTQNGEPVGRGPMWQAINRRASGFIYRHDANAAKHIRAYQHAIESWRSTAVFL